MAEGRSRRCFLGGQETIEGELQHNERAGNNARPVDYSVSVSSWACSDVNRTLRAHLSAKMLI